MVKRSLDALPVRQVVENANFSAIYFTVLCTVQNTVQCNSTQCSVVHIRSTSQYCAEKRSRRRDSLEGRLLYCKALTLTFLTLTLIQYLTVTLEVEYETRQVRGLQQQTASLQKPCCQIQLARI